MKPTGYLMIEHRLIERMVILMEDELQRIKQAAKINTVFIDAAVDFFRTYADRTHHGKEEDILFKALEQKPLAAEHKRIMDELIQEHIYARNKVAGLVGAKEQFLKGDEQAINQLVTDMEDLVKLYPAHIKKEDKVFFPYSLEYLTEPEQEGMLRDFFEFDRKMIHEKYGEVVEYCERANQ